MESISVFDIFKIGVGPSSSHTMGPWRAAERFLAVVRAGRGLAAVSRVRIDLFGSLAKTGHGHGTDVAVIMGLMGEDPETCEVATINDRIEAVKQAGRLRLGGAGGKSIEFDYEHDLLFHMSESLPFHPNGLRFTAILADGAGIEETYYSIGGGFVVQEKEEASGARAIKLPHPIDHGDDLAGYCRRLNQTIPRIVMANERAWRTDEQIRAGLLRIWRTMQECVYRGCHTEGVLPGGLNVVRRAAAMNRKLLYGEGFSGLREYDDVDGWLELVCHSTREFRQTLKWVSTFALAVNEENAAFGRVVTAPTNGAAGVIPAVMMYDWCFNRGSGGAGGVEGVGEDGPQRIIDFMLTAGELGSLFKKGATISAAMGGCQAEIGVSSAMAAGGLCQVLGGSPDRVLMAAEIAMEHHLGMTCDPIGGLVQIPCIERNTMGAIKAITAANIALEGDPASAKVSLDQVIKTMWETAKDMGSKYKETAEGGLAVYVSVGLPEC
ncbi:MAG: L-serine ammonia-lyase [Phycisphaerales bacterium]|nr:L-serine ammonia-lyase [Phycisphaerales bacterium]